MKNGVKEREGDLKKKYETLKIKSGKWIELKKFTMSNIF